MRLQVSCSSDTAFHIASVMSQRIQIDMLMSVVVCTLIARCCTRPSAYYSCRLKPLHQEQSAFDMHVSCHDATKEFRGWFDIPSRSISITHLFSCYAFG